MHMTWPSALISILAREILLIVKSDLLGLFRITIGMSMIIWSYLKIWNNSIYFGWRKKNFLHELYIFRSLRLFLFPLNKFSQLWRIALSTVICVIYFQRGEIKKMKRWRLSCTLFFLLYILIWGNGSDVQPLTHLQFSSNWVRKINAWVIVCL